jgi:molecular chaperone HtpG
LHDTQDEARFAELVHVLFDQAILAEGGQLQNPAEFIKRMNLLLIAS